MHLCVFPVTFISLYTNIASSQCNIYRSLCQLLCLTLLLLNMTRVLQVHLQSTYIFVPHWCKHRTHAIKYWFWSLPLHHVCFFMTDKNVSSTKDDKERICTLHSVVWNADFLFKHPWYSDIVFGGLKFSLLVSYYL